MDDNGARGRGVVRSTSIRAINEALINHICLPPQLPQRQDGDIEGVEAALVDRVIDAAKLMRDLPGNESADSWDTIRQSVLSCKEFIASGRLERSILRSELKRVAEGGFLLLHVRCQNAVLFVRPSPTPTCSVVFEAFEASPRCEDVLATNGALLWDFPGSAVEIPLPMLKDDGFLDELCPFLEQASSESTNCFAAQTNKAGQSTMESRDTGDPKLITSMLVALLEANGKKISPVILRKRVRDDVCWNNAHMPWRRLPLWLALRVALRRYLAISVGDAQGRVEYKFFMCAVHMQLLGSVTTSTSPERLLDLKSKLCRRLVKLEGDKDLAPANTIRYYEYYRTHLHPKLGQIITEACKHITGQMDEFRAATTKIIPPLPRAAESTAMKLKLSSSGAYLTEVLSRFRNSSTRSAPMRSKKQKSDETFEFSQHQSQFPMPYFKLAEMEADVAKMCCSLPATMVADKRSFGDLCLTISQKIGQYLSAVSKYYDRNTGQKSIMILTIMELWMRLDQAACIEYPLLEDYHPVFIPESLDILHLEKYEDMVRLQTIQAYLGTRISRCGASAMNIFADPCRGCFAERYCDESPDSIRLEALLKMISNDANQARQMKQEEWKSKSEEYEKMMKVVNESTCILQVDPFDSSVTRHDPQCPRCRIQQRASRMSIRIFEEPLPADPVVAKVVAFEIDGEHRAFEAYRDATWLIISKLGYSKLDEGVTPKCCVRDYSELRAYTDATLSSLTLASTTKSFLNTHYAQISIPVEWDHVCRPNGLKYGYCDLGSKSWPGRRFCKPSFTHHCGLDIPLNSPFAAFMKTAAVEGPGPTSYEIIASSPNCPNGANVHEFLALQTLLSGRDRRMVSLLVELGSSNLNFSSEATLIAVKHIVLQCGPNDEHYDPFRMVHRVFHDEHFCRKLTEQLTQRLDGVTANWREVHLMEIIITIALRQYILLSAKGVSQASAAAMGLILKARRVTFQWMKLLGDEVKRATDTEAAHRCQSYALWAAILCKRTFMVHCGQTDALDPQSLRVLIECSITLQNNLLGNIETLPYSQKNAIIKDFKMMHDMQDLVMTSITSAISSFISALACVWPASDDEPRQIATWQLHDSMGVITMTIASADEFSRDSEVYYDIKHGLLLVGGMPIGRLPAEHQNSVILTRLFGDQSLLTYPSDMQGMMYQLCIRPEGYRVHIGFHHDQMIVRACKGSRIMELIPREVFGGPNFFDLPGPLISNCFHWLDLRAGQLEITPSFRIWRMSAANWKLDVRTGECCRFIRKFRREVLVDPHSPLFHRTARIFDGLEYRNWLTVWQCYSNSKTPWRLIVELKRLQLRLFVNQRRLLQAIQFPSEVDPDQNIGTWHGLDSKLVFRSIENHQRTVLVPLGEIEAGRAGNGVVVKVQTVGQYGKFQVNEVLGRIECAAEPTLIYRKAQLHAYTSSALPDRLTGRTGTEEALHWLSSAICQPWTPLTKPHINILKSIAQLSPHRTYYPTEMKVMKREVWDEQLTISIQHDAYKHLVDQIIAKSTSLTRFESDDAETEVLQSCGDAHLNLRAWLAWQRMHRYAPSTQAPTDSVDRPYQSRDRGSASNMAYANVVEAITIIRSWPTKICTEKKLATSLAQSPLVKGYNRTFDKLALGDRLNINVRQDWGPLVAFARQHSTKFSLMFFLAPISFRFDSDMAMLRTILAFAIFEELRHLEVPLHPEYAHYRPEMAPHMDYLLHMIKPYQIPPPKDDRDAIREFMSSKSLRKLREERSRHEKKSEDDCKSLAKALLEQWPCAQPKVPIALEALLVDVTRAMEALLPEWERLFRNMEFSEHLKSVQAILDKHQSEETFKPAEFVQSIDFLKGRMRGLELPRLTEDLMEQPGPQFDIVSPTDFAEHFEFEEASDHGTFQPWHKRAHSGAPVAPWYGKGATSRERTMAATDQAKIVEEIGELSTIIHKCMESKSAIRRRYGEDLLQSLEAFSSRGRKTHAASVWRRQVLNTAKLLGDVDQQMRDIKAALLRPYSQNTSDIPSRVCWLQAGLLWPAVTPVTLLEQLRSTTACLFGSNMKESIVQLGLKITELQRQRRLNDLTNKCDPDRFHEEMSNRGHVNWKPQERPDWLLLEIESNILIRPDQVDVALATISPASGANSVLQMNMGQGKTSCIIPMAALVLADGKHLARVVVPKALLQQTATLLHSRLGVLLNRELRHVPFSRRTAVNDAEKKIRLYGNIHKNMLVKSGVIICLPDHSLSFFLSGQQRLLDNKVTEATLMIRTQAWLKTVCRDILDESDHTLAVRTQLIYPSGPQMTVDGHPHRWQAVEGLLKLVDIHLHGLQQAFPHSIEVVRRPTGGFPLVFFLRADVEEELVRRLTADICNGSGGVLPINTLDRSDRIAIKEFISAAKLRAQTIEKVKVMCPDQLYIRQICYLLRGLLVNRILMMTLKKRWNVQYGLHPLRDPIAVPFYAKGVPSDQSEWGHPDVAILFTCLAFYYDGITLPQLRQALEHVLKSDDPSSEYDRWTQSVESLPDSLRDWSVINLDDSVQLSQVWDAVRHNVIVIDYFLNNFVFPRHAKQFKVKLQSNGWDIPFMLTKADESFIRELTKSSKHRASEAMTTGFSGTNDNRTMLPLNIEQQDLPQLSHTSAEVLTYLLHCRNRGYAVIADKYGKRLSEESFLSMLHDSGIKVLIDAGAQILEMDNLSLVKKWLQIDYKAPAALYFDDKNKPWIITRQHSKTPLLASTFAEDLSDCLVYLDEAHTRGTDLKFPAGIRGALTLGLGQTKDHTVQAAMRLRQLASSQSIMFFAPPEVHQSILDLQGKNGRAELDSSDVIGWLLHNTCEGLEQLQPLYYSQGIDFCRRMQAAANYPDFLTDRAHRERYIAAIKQDEQQTLQQLYEPKTKGRGPSMKTAGDPQVAVFVKELNTRRRAFQDSGNAVHGSALQEVEQEREVAFEVESVRHVKKPRIFQPLKFQGLHKDIEMFAKTGRTAAGGSGYFHMYRVLSRTGLGRKFDIDSRASKSNLFVSAEFERTVKLTSELTNDTFLRPVNWILWSEVSKTAMIVVPEEAERLIRIVRSADHNRTFLLTYAAPTTRKMLHFNQLSYYTVPTLPEDWEPPTWLKVEVGLFAGRLYFEWNEYETMCQLVGKDEDALSWEAIDQDAAEQYVKVGQLSPCAMPHNAGDEDNGLVAASASISKPRQFASNPLTFLQEWLAVRRRGQDFIHTPMGYMTQGKPLQENHPFFRRKEEPQRHTLRPVSVGRQMIDGADSDPEYDEEEEGDDDLEEVLGGMRDLSLHGGASKDANMDVIVYDDTEMYPGKDGEEREEKPGRQGAKGGMPKRSRTTK